MKSTAIVWISIHSTYYWSLTGLVCYTGAFLSLECQYSKVKGNFISPNISDIYFDHRLVADYRTGDNANLTGTQRYFSFLLPVPNDCSGTVKAIQSCYQIRNGNYSSVEYLKFQVFSRMEKYYYAIKSFNVTAIPSTSTCNRTFNHNQRNQIVCCETISLESSSYFNISSINNFTYAVTLLNQPNVRLLRFNTTYRVE